MSPAALLAILDASLTLAESILPAVAGLARARQITPQQQQAVLDRVEKLRAAKEEAFQGPEWEM